MKSASRYIIGIICLMLVVLRIIYPSIITIPKISLDKLNISILIIGISLLTYPLIVKMIKRVIDILSIRLVISVFCFSLVILKMFNKNIVIDNSSIYLIIISIVVALIPDIKDVFDRLKKIKTNNFELEFTLKDLLGKVEKLEENIDENVDECVEENIGKNKLNYGGLDSNITVKFEKVASEPNALILMIGIEIENRINKLLLECGLEEKKYIPFKRSLEALYKLEIINRDVMNLINEFRYVRNRVAHGAYMENEISQKQLYTVAEIGLRVLNILPTEIIS